MVDTGGRGGAKRDIRGQSKGLPSFVPSLLTYTHHIKSHSHPYTLANYPHSHHVLPHLLQRTQPLPLLTPRYAPPGRLPTLVVHPPVPHKEDQWWLEER